MIHALAHHLHLDSTAAPLDRLWRLMTEVEAIIVTAAAGGSISTSIPPLLALAINAILELGGKSFQNPEQ